MNYGINPNDCLLIAESYVSRVTYEIYVCLLVIAFSLFFMSALIKEIRLNKNDKNLFR